jgi:hypothetical protein
MIQYSSINDAWGNKEIYKKNTLNNIDGFNNSKPIETFISQKLVQDTSVLQNIVPQNIVPQNIVPQNIVPQNIVPQNIVPQNIVPQNIVPQNKEHFVDISTNITNSCNIAEHLKNCEHCRNSLNEHFVNDNSILQFNIFGLKINIKKDVFKVIFIILIVLIFIIILSTINISLIDKKLNMDANMKIKYYMLPNVQGVPNNVQFYH